MPGRRAWRRGVAKGEGGLSWNDARQRWVGRVSLGYNADGKRRIGTVSARTKTEARTKLRTLLRDHDDGLPTQGCWTRVPQHPSQQALASRRIGNFTASARVSQDMRSAQRDLKPARSCLVDEPVGSLKPERSPAGPPVPGSLRSPDVSVCSGPGRSSVASSQA